MEKNVEISYLYDSNFQKIQISILFAFFGKLSVQISRGMRKISVTP
jgi:hypothetical protein